MLLLGLNFFVLSSEYKRNLMDEFFYLSRDLSFTYNDLLKMPTFERKYFMSKIIESYKKD